MLAQDLLPSATVLRPTEKFFTRAILFAMGVAPMCQHWINLRRRFRLARLLTGQV
jgi:hypothetical protein